MPRMPHMSEAAERLSVLKRRKQDIQEELRNPALHSFNDADVSRMKQSLAILTGLITLSEEDVAKEVAEKARKQAIIDEEKRKKRERMAELQHKLDLIWNEELRLTEIKGKYVIVYPNSFELVYSSHVWEKKLAQTCTVFGVRPIYWEWLLVSRVRNC